MALMIDDRVVGGRPQRPVEWRQQPSLPVAETTPAPWRVESPARTHGAAVWGSDSSWSGPQANGVIWGGVIWGGVIWGGVIWGGVIWGEDAK